MLNEFFQTTDVANMPLNEEQKKAIKKDVQFVKGSDFYKGYYKEDVLPKMYVRFFQLGMFDGHDGKRPVRSFLLEGETSKGACFYEYKVKEIKDYRISQKTMEKFVDSIKNKKTIKTPKGDFKVMFKYYPVYNFDYTNPPTGNDINECMSELLFY
jgi:hypothetical protein